MGREEKLTFARELANTASAVVAMLRDSKYADASLATYDRMRIVCDVLAASTAADALEQTDFVEHAA